MGNIKNIKEIGEFQTYDLEVDHPDHQFYLANGVLTSNSHAILYSMGGYKTAYLKAHYPIEFLLANLMAEVKSNAPTAQGNITQIKKELRKHRIKVVSPDVNKSQLVYTIEGGNHLITGLDAIKFVGDDAIKDIIAKRPFKTFLDFMVRVSSKAVRANSIQALAACGALDSFNIPRKMMFLHCSDFRKKLQVWLKKHDPNTEEFVYPYPSNDEWSQSELYALEQFYLGEAFICKPAVAYGEFFNDCSLRVDKSDHTTVQDIKKSKDRTNFRSIKGIVRDFYEFRVKKEGKNCGLSMLKAVIEDKNGEQCSLTIFPERWKAVKERLKEIGKKISFDVGMALHFSGNANSYEDNMGVILDQLFDIALPPAMPNDLKQKKINLKELKAQAAGNGELEKTRTPQEILDQIEDVLYDEGLVDLEEENEID